MRMQGVYDSETFTSKTAAKEWATRREAEIMGGQRGEIPNLTVAALLERYEREVSVHKKGRRWESIRLRLLGRDRLAQVRLKSLDTPHASDWQQRRLQDVSSASVRRERNLLNNVFNVAVWEWKWLRRNPFGENGRALRRPKDSKPRDRVATLEEQAILLKEASQSLGRAIMVALETGMRCGEIPSAKVRGNVARVDGKTGERDVPLSAKAKQALEEGIGLTAGSISELFGRLVEDLKISDLTFHDLKHTAMTRLSKKLDPWELAKMTGNKDMNLLLRVYYKHDPEETAKKL